MTFQHIVLIGSLSNVLFDKLNKRCKGRLAEEQKKLAALPRHRFIDYLELTVKVTTTSTISVKRTLYTVPSRLIGENLRIHLYHDRLECFVGQTLGYQTAPTLSINTKRSRAANRLRTYYSFSGSKTTSLSLLTVSR